MTILAILVEIECHQCHMLFAMPKEFQQQKLDNRNNTLLNIFYCPAGHGQQYIGKSDVDKLRDNLKAEQHRADENYKWAKAAENRARAQKSATSRIRNRIENGVCIHCKRSFKNLRDHMNVKHKKK